MVWDMGERRRKSGTFLRVVRTKRPVWGSGRCVAGENGREWRAGGDLSEDVVINLVGGAGMFGNVVAGLGTC